MNTAMNFQFDIFFSDSPRVKDVQYITYFVKNLKFLFESLNMKTVNWEFFLKNKRLS